MNMDPIQNPRSMLKLKLELNSWMQLTLSERMKKFLADLHNTKAIEYMAEGYRYEPKFQIGDRVAVPSQGFYYVAVIHRIEEPFDLVDAAYQEPVYSVKYPGDEGEQEEQELDEDEEEMDMVKETGLLGTVTNGILGELLLAHYGNEFKSMAGIETEEDKFLFELDQAARMETEAEWRATMMREYPEFDLTFKQWIGFDPNL